MRFQPMRYDAAARARVLDVMVADNALTRMRGLLARPPLGRGQGLLIKPCNMIHTLGMVYPIDVVFLGRDGVVLRVASAVAAASRATSEPFMPMATPMSARLSAGAVRSVSKRRESEKKVRALTIVDAITRDAHNLAALLQVLANDQLVLRPEKTNKQLR